jgi:hypothetical protein
MPRNLPYAKHDAILQAAAVAARRSVDFARLPAPPGQLPLTTFPRDEFPPVTRGRVQGREKDLHD